MKSISYQKEKSYKIENLPSRRRLLSNHYFLLSILAFLLCSHTVFAQPVISITDENGTNIINSINFGDVWFPREYPKTLTITNNGNDDLIISLVVQDAGFDIPNALTTDKIEPGQKVSLTVRFRTTEGTVGPKSGLLTIDHNGTGSPTLVQLSANFRGSIVNVSPPVGSSITFDNANRTENVIVTNNTNEKITITCSITGKDPGSFIATPSSSFSVTLGPNGEPDGRYEIPVTFTSTSEGTKNAALSINVASIWNIDIGLIGNVTVERPIISTNPVSLLDFSNVPVNSPLGKSITILNTGTANLVISQVTISTGFTWQNATTPITIAAGGSHTIIVLFSPTVAGPHTGTITLTHNSAPGTVTTIQLRGTGIALAPMIRVYPDNIDFGNLIIGNNMSDTVIIYNIGNAQLNISSSQTGDPVFTVLGLGNQPIVPGESHFLPIQFSPKVVGSYSGTVTITHNATNLPTPITIKFKGKGVNEGDVGDGEPNISVTPESINFGTVLIGEKSGRRKVTITNLGNAKLEISSISVVFDGNFRLYYANPVTISSGQSHVFEVAFEPGTSGSGNRTACLMINHNVTGRTPICIYLYGTGEGLNLSITPNSLNFGNINVGSESEPRKITITNNSLIKLDLRLSYYRPGNTDNSLYIFDPKFSDGFPLESGESKKIDILFKPESAGSKTIELLLSVIDSNQSYPISPRISLTGVGTGTAVIEIEPTDGIDFGNINVESSLQKKVTIRNTGNIPLVISQISITGGVFTLPNGETTITIQPGKSYDLGVQFLPLGSGLNSGSITLRHNAEGSPTDIPLNGRGITYGSTGTIEIPREINFGEVVLGDQKCDTLTIKNNNTGPLTIINAPVTGTNKEDFELVEPTTPDTIQAGENDNFKLKFEPNSTGERTANMEIHHNNQFVPSPIYVRLLGIGVPPPDPEPIIEIDTTTLDIINPMTINFGDVEVENTSSPRSVTIKNIGTAPLVISSFDISPDVFKLPNEETTKTIEPDSNYTLTVQFKPTAATPYSGTIILIHNAISSPDTIQLIGNGVPLPEPIIEIDTTTLDIINPMTINFGDVLVENTSSPRSVTIKNIGTASLVISSFDISPDVFTLPNRETTKTIEPGESYPLTVQFSPNAVGSISGTIILIHNAISSPDTIQLIGNGVPLPEPIIEIDTTTLDIINPMTINFDDVIVDSSLQKSVTIKNIGTADLIISDISISPSVFTLPNGETTRTVTIKPDSNYTLTVQFSPNAVGSISGTLTLTHNSNNVTDSTTTILLNGKGVPLPEPIIEIDTTTLDIINPMTINFGDVNVGSSSQKNVTIKNIGTAPLVISLFTILPDVFRLPNGETTRTIQPGESYPLTVQFSPNAVGSISGTIILTHNAISSPDTVRLTGRGVQAGITITPDTLDFGDVTINSSSTENITIENHGTAPLDISNFFISGGVFTFPNNENTTVSLQNPIIISPGGDTTITVQFKPTEVGPHSGTVILVHNATGSPDTVQLIGNGVQPGITITPNPLNFGDVLINSSKIDSITIQNNGNAALVITQVYIKGTGFTFPNNENTTVSLQNPIIILPGGDTTIAVQFLPTETDVYTGFTITLTHNASGSPSVIILQGAGIRVRVSIPKDYVVKPSDTVKISVKVIDDLTDKNVKDFSFTLKYNKRILSFDDVVLSGTLSNSLTPYTTGSTPGELKIMVTNNAGTPLTDIGSLIDINFIGLRGDSCGTHLFLESFEFNSDSTNVITENGYCELIGGCKKGETYVTTDRTSLYQNSPNPIQAGYESTIQYRIHVAGETNITVYDILGREVTRLVNEYKSEGTYSVIFNTKGLPSGVYFYRLRAPGYEGLKKMIVIK